MPVREAKPEDAPGMARVRVDSWRDAYRGIVPDETLDSLSYEAVEKFLRLILWEDNHGSFAYVAEDQDGQVVGVAVAGPVLNPGETEYKGEIYILYVLPTCQGQGFGRALGLIEKNLNPVILWTFALNPARAFYEKLGGKVVREQEVEEGGKLLAEVGYGWIDAQVLCRLRANLGVRIFPRAKRDIIKRNNRRF